MTASSEAIRADINKTRGRITHDLDEIGERLNPHKIKQDIKDGIRDATIGRVEDMARHAEQRVNDAGAGIVQRVKDNPIPAVMAAAGIAWLLMGKARTQTSGPGTVDKAKDKVGDMAEQAQEAVSSATTPKIETAKSAFEDHPIALGAGVVALGLVTGLLAPSTRSEHRIVGDIGQQVVDKVSEVAKEAGEKAQHVAERAMEETKTASRDEGLTSSGSQAARAY